MPFLDAPQHESPQSLKGLRKCLAQHLDDREFLSQDTALESIPLVKALYEGMQQAQQICTTQAIQEDDRKAHM